MTETTVSTEPALLDANVLIAAHFEDHEHHTAADSWLQNRRFATTPSTQGSLLRYALRVAGVEAAVTILDALATNAAHVFWPDDEPFSLRILNGVRGHRQLTDSHLASAAERHRTKLATFDGGLKQLRPEVVELLGT